MHSGRGRTISRRDSPVCEGVCVRVSVCEGKCVQFMCAHKGAACAHFSILG